MTNLEKAVNIEEVDQSRFYKLKLSIEHVCVLIDVGNKFSIISPTHDFKIVTRLQHVTQPL